MDSAPVKRQLVVGVGGSEAPTALTASRHKNKRRRLHTHRAAARSGLFKSNKEGKRGEKPS